MVERIMNVVAGKIGEAGPGQQILVRDSTDETNPKDLVGARKVSITAIPMTALVHCAVAMMDGVRKYGHSNWRHKKVQARIFVDAAFRHLMAFEDGEELAPDSLAHHLGHAMACCAILLDAIETKRLIDNRPLHPDTLFVTSNLLARMERQLKEQEETRRRLAADEAKRINNSYLGTMAKRIADDIDETVIHGTWNKKTKKRRKKRAPRKDKRLGRVREAHTGGSRLARGRSRPARSRG